MNHNLKPYQFLLLVACFGFGKAIVRKLKVHKLIEKLRFHFLFKKQQNGEQLMRYRYTLILAKLPHIATKSV
jgi:hypothetical protein